MIWTALILGFAGSLHCIGMCSPLAMAVTNLSTKAMSNRLLYNMGRIFTYGVLGAIIASVGFALPMAKYQDLLSVMMGIILVSIGFLSVTYWRISFVSVLLSKLNIVLKKKFSYLLQRKNLASVFLLGTLNGFLPCGLTFLALSYCVILKTPIEGFSFMAMFGLGTLPALLGFTKVFTWMVHRFNLRLQQVSPSLFVISGILLIARVFIIHLPHANSVASGMLDIVTCGK